MKKNGNKKVARFYLPAVILFYVLITPHLSRAWGIVEGVIQNGAGAPIATARIETDLVSTTTVADGTYQMSHLPGVYTFTASAQGYAPLSKQAEVLDSQTITLDFTLQPSPPKIERVTPNFGETRTDLDVLIQGTGFDAGTKLSMYQDSGNRSKIIGSIDAPPMFCPEDVTLVGNTAYVSDGTNGLQIVDIANPAQPSIAGTYDTSGYSYETVIVGSIAYVADSSSGLKIIDISDPSFPGLIDSVETYGTLGLDVVGNVAYSASSTSGLMLIDINPLSGTYLDIIATVDTPNRAYGVSVSDGIAYVADNWSGVQIVDVDPASDTYLDIIGSIDIGTAEDLTVAGNYLYVAEYSGFYILDVTDPTNPTVAGSVDIQGGTLDVNVVGDTAYVAGDNAGIYIIDISDRTNPVITGSVSTTHRAMGLTVNGSIAYIADCLGGLKLIDVSSPPVNPPVVGAVQTESFVEYAGVVVGNTVFVTATIDATSGLKLIDIDPSSATYLQITGSVEVSGGVTAVASGIAYVGSNMVDVDPASGTYLEIIGTQPFGLIKTIVGDTGYADNNDGDFQILDISTPSEPTSIGVVDVPGVILEFEVVEPDNKAYVLTSTDEFVVIDISTPSNPAVSGSVSAAFTNVWDLAVKGDWAYVTDLDQRSGSDAVRSLWIIDISDPNSPSVVTSFETADYPYDVDVIGNIAYVAVENLGVQALDISDPSHPVDIGSIDTPGLARDMNITSDYIFVADGYGFVIVPRPVAVTSFTVDSSTTINATLPSPPTTGNYTLRAYSTLQGDELIGAVTYTDKVDLLHARAIIVAGGGPEATGDIWEETKNYAQEAYNSLIYQGYMPENIYYITDDAAAQGRDASASPQNLQYAITGWANDDPDTNSLVLYLVDHGEDQRFQMRGNATPELAEYVTSAELDSWLDTLQEGSSIKVLLVYDACHSGSFVDTLNESDDTRVVITSVAEEEVAYFLDLKQSFSGIFWGTLSGKTGTQGNLYNAWTLASDNMSFYQAAQLDANGNGVTNEPEDVDALEQNIFEIGRQWFNADFSRPVVNSIAADQVLNGTTSTSLTAFGIYDLDQDDIVRVWAEIIAPDHVPGNDLTITSLPSVDLTDPDEDDIYTAVFPDDAGGTYAGFDTRGTYIINYYAEDSSGVYSEPKTALVTQQDFSPVLIPDQYEDDDTASLAQVIVLNSPTPQEHSFHDTGDQDWVMFYGLADEVYSVRAMNPTVISDPVISIYSGSNLNTPVVSSNSAAMGAEEILKNWTCPSDGLYYVQVTNNSGHYGANVRYKLKVYNPIAFSLPGYVKGKITSGSQGVAGAVIRAGGGTAITLADGSFVLCLTPGSYSVSVSCDGYQSTSFSVNLDSGQSVSLSRDMNSVPRILNHPSTVIKTNEEFSYIPSVSDADGDPLTFAITGSPSWANFSTANGRLWGRPGAADQGVYGPITIKVSDNGGASDSVTFTLKVEQGTAGSLPGVMLLLQEVE